MLGTTISEEGRVNGGTSVKKDRSEAIFFDIELLLGSNTSVALSVPGFSLVGC